MINHRLSFSRFFTLLVAFSMLGQTSVLAQQPVTPKPPSSAADRRLETIEELSESLANDILTLSVAARDRDAELTREYFPPIFTGKIFPSRPTTTVNQVKWVGVHKWEAATPALPAVTVAAKPNDPGVGKITNKLFLESG